MDFAHGVTARGHPHAKPARKSSHDHKQVMVVHSMEKVIFALELGFGTASCHFFWILPSKMRLMSIKVQVGEGGSLLGEEVVGHMVNEHLAEQLGEVYRSDPLHNNDIFVVSIQFIFLLSSIEDLDFTFIFCLLHYISTAPQTTFTFFLILCFPQRGSCGKHDGGGA